MNYRSKDQRHGKYESGDVHVNGEFTLREPVKFAERDMIGNYLEVVLHKKLGDVSQIKRPNGESQPVRGYELVIHHSAIHGDGPYEKVRPPEIVKFQCSSTIDAILREQPDGAQLTIRPVMVQKRLGPGQKLMQWYVLAIDGVYKNPATGAIDFVPHNSLLER